MNRVTNRHVRSNRGSALVSEIAARPRAMTLSTRPTYKAAPLDMISVSLLETRFNSVVDPCTATAALGRQSVTESQGVVIHEQV